MNIDTEFNVGDSVCYLSGDNIIHTSISKITIEISYEDDIRTFFLSGIELSDFFAAGFKINKIQSQKIDADAYCDILLNKTD